MKREVLLNTGSTIEEGRLAKGGSKMTDGYMIECAVCEIGREDFEALGRPDRVKVTAPDGKHSVTVYARPGDSVHRGQVFMPRAIWANVIVDAETFSTGSPLYKGSPVTIQPSSEEVLSAEEIVLRVYAR